MSDIIDNAPPPAPVEQPAPEYTNVLNPEGELVAIPSQHVQDATGNGYQIASPEDVAAYAKQQKYGSPTQQAITGLEGAAEGATFGLSTGAERALGVNPEDITARREENPISHGVGQVAGIAGSALIPEVGAASLLEKAGAGTAEALGVGGGGAMSKIGSGAVKAAVENAMVQGGDETSKMFAQDPNQSAQTAIVDMGLAGLIGAGAGGAFGAINPLWTATVGSKTGGMLKALSDKAGGIEGIMPDAVRDAINTSGIDVAPEVRASISKYPELNAYAKDLETAANGSGAKYQEALRDTKQKMNEGLVSALGKDYEKVIDAPQISKYEAGKSLGDTLAHEYSEKMDPLAKEFEALKDKVGDIKLAKDVRTPGEYAPDDIYHLRPPEDVVSPGASTNIINKVTTLATEQGWDASPSSDIMREVRRVVKEVPNLKSIKDLGKYITAVGDNTASALPFGQQTPLSRAGSMIKGILKEVESDAVMQKLGQEGPELVARYQAARDAYKAQSALKEALNDRLGAGGSTSGFAKNIRNMAQTDGERVLSRLGSGKDADLLNILNKEFPKTAEALRNYHVDSLLSDSVGKARGEEALSSKALRKGLESMSPELRDFITIPESQEKINAIGTLMDALEAKSPKGTSGALSNAMKNMPGSAAGMLSYLTGHGAFTSGIIGGLASTLKSVPDAIKLATLKFLGSSQPLEAQGFKTMVDFVQHTIKGENLISKAAKNVFKAGSEVLPESAMPSESDRNKLDKKLKALQQDPSDLEDVGGKTGHYLPEHATALAQTAGNVVNYVNSQRPNTQKQNPLDSDRETTPAQKAAFDRVLNIAQQPMVVVSKIKSGTVTPQEVQAMKTMYPDLYARVSQKLSDQMFESVHKGDIIPYSTRMGLGLFLGQNLDSTMTPSAIQAAQPQSQDQQQSSGKGGGGGTKAKHSMAALGKIGKMDATPGQAREMARSKHEG